MIFPSWTNMVRVLYSADFFEWVTIIIVFFFSKFIFCNSSIISVPVFESRFPIGSSARITSGLFIRARAIATRCCWPPESSRGVYLRLFESPTMSIISSSSFLKAEAFLPSRRIGRSIFSSTLRLGMRL